MPVTLGDFVQRFLVDRHRAARFTDDKHLVADYLLSSVESTCMSSSKVFYPRAHGQYTSQEHLLTDFAATPTSLTLPITLPKSNQPWACQEVEPASAARPEAAPLVFCLFADLLYGQRTGHIIDCDAASHLFALNAVTRDAQFCSQGQEELLLLRVAVILAKLATCAMFTNSMHDLDSIAWWSLDILKGRVMQLVKRWSSQHRATLKPELQEETLLCVVLLQILLPVIKQSAKAPSQQQHRASLATSLIFSVSHLRGVRRPQIADELISLGRSSTASSPTCAHALQITKGGGGCPRAVVQWGIMLTMVDGHA